MAPWDGQASDRRVRYGLSKSTLTPGLTLDAEYAVPIRIVDTGSGLRRTITTRGAVAEAIDVYVLAVGDDYQRFRLE